MARIDLSLPELRTAQDSIRELQSAQTNAFEILDTLRIEGVPDTDFRVKNIRHVIANNRRGSDGLRALNNALESEPYNK